MLSLLAIFNFKRGKEREGRRKDFIYKRVPGIIMLSLLAIFNLKGGEKGKEEERIYK
jgi:hypothetical protein